MVTNRSRRWRSCVAAGVLMSLATPVWADDLPAALPESTQVQPIDWQRFRGPVTTDARYEACVQLVRNCSKYNVAWISGTFELNSEGDAYLLTGNSEHDVRPACSVIYGMATLLKTGLYDAVLTGVDTNAAKQETIRLLRGVVRAHCANSDDDSAWGVRYPAPDPATYWQSGLWAALSGMGGWMLWEDLDSDTQVQLMAMLDAEAKRFLADDYHVPYWNGQGGDTKAEENSWNSMLLTLLVAMRPEHPDTPRLKQRCTELIVSSYSTERDWKGNSNVVDGRKVSEWLNGYNALAGGVVINHDFIHPDYMVAVSMNFWGLTTQSLADAPVTEAWDFNAPLVYNTCVEKQWRSPPYDKPGGTIYLAGRPDVYYPQGTDWSRQDYTLFYLMDVYAGLYSWNDQAPTWCDVRADAMLAMQQRHADRRMFAAGEYDTYPGREQWAFWCLTDAFLPQWLEKRQALGKKQDWLATP